MKRWLASMVLGITLGSVTLRAAEPERLQETMLAVGGGESLVIPQEYGPLVDVAVSSGVHHLYFQDSQGRIRIVLVGARGAKQGARHAVELLTDSVYVIQRKPRTDP